LKLVNGSAASYAERSSLAFFFRYAIFFHVFQFHCERPLTYTKPFAGNLAFLILVNYLSGKRQNKEKMKIAASAIRRPPRNDTKLYFMAIYRENKGILRKKGMSNVQRPI
jgi:hypothetical protein